MLTLLAAAAAAPGVAFAAETMPIDNAFPYLAAYLGLAMGDRSRFYLAYRAYREKHPVADPRAIIVGANGQKTPIAFDRLGVVVRPPGLAELKSGAQVMIDGPPFQLQPELRCAITLSTRIDVAELSLALVQVNKDIAKFAGALSFIVPKFTAAYFPDAGAAEALLADGRQTPLPVFAFPNLGSVSYIEPAVVAGAKSVVLARAPSRIVLGGHPKKS
jgi:hypothetical protein